MIVDKEIELKVNGSQLKHFNSIGLDVKSGDVIKINPSQLNRGSNIKILCRCDVCGKEKLHPYRRYTRSTDNGGYYSCSTKCAQDKTKNTFLENYGVEHHFQSKSSKDKIKETFIKNYGTDHFTHSDEYQNRVGSIVSKRHNTIDTKYISSEGLISISDGLFTLHCGNHNGEYEIDRKLYHTRKQHNIDTCTICYPLNENVSIKELELRSFIEDHVKGVKPNHKIGGKEVDVFIPHLKLGFEFNGLHWHSEEFIPNDYHLNKTKICLENNIHLIHIYEDEWDNNRDIVKSRILNLLKSNITTYYARKCHIKVITPKVYKEFCDNNHTQGSVNSRIKLGLFSNEMLVSVMGFGQLRKSLGQTPKENHYEMLRFCNKLNTSVVGGASKLFKYFIKNYEPREVISYADRSWSNGSLYETLGFNMVSETKPNYYYIIKKVRYNRYNFRKDKLVSDGYDKDLTEKQIMINRGINRIYDSGSLKYVYNKKPS